MYIVVIETLKQTTKLLLQNSIIKQLHMLYDGLFLNGINFLFFYFM